MTRITRLKRIHLLRHAKASRLPADGAEPGLADMSRPLNPRGERAAAAMGAHMAAAGFGPDLVLCSPARRTRQTWAFVAPALAMDGVLPEDRFRYDARLYDATAEALLALVRDLPDAVRSVLLIAHNPGLQDLALALIGSPPSAPDDEAVARLAAKFPTAALAVLSVPAERWVDLAPGRCRLDAFVRPADLKGAGS